jgi:hypothetical protein
VTSEQAASSARERRTMTERGLRDMMISWKGGTTKGTCLLKRQNALFFTSTVGFLSE